LKVEIMARSQAEARKSSEFSQTVSQSRKPDTIPAVYPVCAYAPVTPAKRRLEALLARRIYGRG
jgi:hypothetical protein